MKKLLLTMMAAFAMTVTATHNVIANDVEHYEGAEFENKKEAMKALIETTNKMAALAADETLDVSKMEAIHETSYTTEDAVAYLNKKSKLDDLATKLEEVHISSEEHEADKVRRNFIVYQAELVAFLSE